MFIRWLTCICNKDRIHIYSLCKDRTGLFQNKCTEMKMPEFFFGVDEAKTSRFLGYTKQ